MSAEEVAALKEQNAKLMARAKREIAKNQQLEAQLAGGGGGNAENEALINKLKARLRQEMAKTKSLEEQVANSGGGRASTPDNAGNTEALAAKDAEIRKLKAAYKRLRDSAPASPQSPTNGAAMNTSQASAPSTPAQDELIKSLKITLKQTMKELESTKSELERVRSGGSTGGEGESSAVDGGGGGTDDVVKELNGKLQAKTEALAKSQDILKKLKDKYDTLKEKVPDEDMVAALHSKIAGLEQEIELLRESGNDDSHMAREVAKARREAEAAKEELQAERSRHQALDTMDADIEMLNLDRDLAVAKCEAMQLDLRALQQELHDLKQELEVFQRAETLEGTIDPESEESVKKSTAKYRAAIKQNETLKQALLVIRDIAVSDRNEFQTTIKEMKAKAESADELAAQNEANLEKIATLTEERDEKAARLQELAPSVEQLDNVQEKCRILQEEISELRVVIEDLEGMQELQDEIEMGYLEQISDLKNDLGYKDQKLKELTEAASQKSDEIREYERRIEKFRAMVADLQEKIAALAPEGSEDMAAEALDDEARVLLNMQVAAQAQAQKNIAERISKELLKMKADEGEEHVTLLESFLPESFFKIDQAPIETRLNIDRLSFKASMLSSVYSEFYNLSAGTLEGKPCSDDELAMVAQLQGKLLRLTHVANQIKEAVRNCDEPLYRRMSSMKYEISSREEELDEFINLILNGELSQSTDMSNLGRIAALLDKLAEQHLPEKQKPQWLAMKEAFEDLLCTNEAVGVSVREVSKKLRKMYDITEGEGGAVTAPSPVVEEIFNQVRDAQAENASISIQARKLVKRIQPRTFQNLPEDTMDQISRCDQTLAQAVTTLKRAVEMFKDKALDADGVIDPVDLRNLFEAAVRQADTTAEFSAGVAHVRAALHGASETVYSIVGSVVNGDYYGDDEPNADDGESVQPMWEVRSQEMLKELSQVVTIKAELQRADEESKDRLAQLKVERQKVMEQQNQVAVMEQRINALKKKVETVDKVQEELDEVRKELKKAHAAEGRARREVEEEKNKVVQANEKIERLEEKLRKNKKRQPLLSLQTALGGSSSPASAAAPSPINRSPVRGSPLRSLRSSEHMRSSEDLQPRTPRAADRTDRADAPPVEETPPMFSEEVRGLKAAVTFLRQENAALKARAGLETILALPDLEVPGLKERRKKPKGVRKDQDSVHDVRAHLQALMKDTVSTVACPTVVSLAKAESSSVQWSQHTARVQRLAANQAELKRRVSELTAHLQPGASAPGFGGHLTKEASKAMHSDGTLKLLGRVSIPSTAAAPSAGRSNRVVVNPRVFQQVHAVFAGA